MVALAAAAAMAASSPTVQSVPRLAGYTTDAARSGQAPDKIKLALEVRTEGRRDRDENATRLFDELRRGLESSPDIELNPREPTPRIVWIVAGTAGPPFAASMMVTERYTRETLMVLGIEDDDIAERMMSLQIANDHQIFTGKEGASIASMIDAMKVIEAEVREQPGVTLVLTGVGGGGLGQVNSANMYVRIEPHEKRVFSIERLWNETLAGHPMKAFEGNYTQRDVMTSLRRTLKSSPW